MGLSAAVALAIITAAAAIVATVASIYTASTISKWRQERAFERRVAWFEQTLQTIRAAQLNAADIARYLPHFEESDQHAVSGLAVQLYHLENRLKLELAQADLFANVTGRRAVQVFMRKLDEQRSELITVLGIADRPGLQYKDMFATVFNGVKAIGTDGASGVVADDATGVAIGADGASGIVADDATGVAIDDVAEAVTDAPVGEAPRDSTAEAHSDGAVPAFDPPIEVVTVDIQRAKLIEAIEERKALLDDIAVKLANEGRTILGNT